MSEKENYDLNDLIFDRVYYELMSEKYDEYKNNLKFCEYEIIEDIGYDIDEMRYDIMKIVGECFNKHLISSKLLLKFFEKHKMNKKEIYKKVTDIMDLNDYEFLIKKFKIEFKKMLIKSINRKMMHLI